MDLNSFDTGTALVVEGGGMRGVFSTGLLDGFLEHNFNPFHLCIGVSAGATSIAAYLAEMKGRNRKIYTELSVGPEFISLSRFLRGGHMMDLDWLWDVTIARMRLKLDKIYSGGRKFLVGMTEVDTGRTVFKETSAADLEHVLKASSALPVFYRGFPVVEGKAMTDGGLSDPIPVEAAVRMGARRIMVIRSRPQDYRSRPDSLAFLLTRFLRRYPALQAAVKAHDRRYNESVAFIRDPPPGVSMVEICPPRDFKTGKFCTDPRALLKGYEQGRMLAGGAIAQWSDHRA